MHVDLELISRQKMKIAELIIAGIAFIGLLMNLLIIPGAGAILVVFLSTLSMFYFGLSVMLFNPEIISKHTADQVQSKTKPLRIIGSVGTGIGLSIALVGILFKMMHWPGSHAMLLVGGIIIGIIAVIATIRFVTTRSVFSRNILVRAAAIGLITLILYMLPPYALLEFKYREYPDYIELVKKSNENPENEELSKKVAEERERMRRSN